MVTLPAPSLKDQLRERSRRLNGAVTYPELCECDHVLAGLGYHLSRLVRSFEEIPPKTELISWTAKSELGTRSIARSLRLCLAQSILHDYEDGDLPLIDDIIERRAVHNDHTLKLSKSSIDVFASSVMDSLTSKYHQGVKDNSAKNWSALDCSPKVDKSHWPPPLPDIEDPILCRQVFTHRSAVTNSPPRSAVEIQQIVNERLEFKGDALLDLIIVNKLCDVFPDHAEGDLTKFKAALVNNNQLWEFAMIYKLADRLSVGVESVSQPYMSDGRKNKVLADTFEAYVAGVAISKGYDFTQRWLLNLYEPFVQILRGKDNPMPPMPQLINADLASSSPTSQYGSFNKNAKAELYSLVGSAEQPIAYRVKGASSPFTVECIVGDTVLGKGVHNSSKTAGTLAAMEALTKSNVLENLSIERARRRSKLATSHH